jgi:hypothetical protein
MNPMQDDQIVRVFSGVFVTIAYTARLIVHGNGPVGFVGYQANSFVVVAAILLLLAVPETLDRLPFGPTRKK